MTYSPNFTITSIDEVRQAIANHPEIREIDKGDYIAFDYMIQDNRTFDSYDSPRNAALRRECRGLIFDKFGNVIRRPFHKFFNINERPETQINDLHGGFAIQHKMDGSMIAPFIASQSLLWGTKKGYTEISRAVHEWVSNHPVYIDFAMSMIELGITPIFEWCSRKNQIVLDYPEDRLILIALREMHTGRYIGTGGDWPYMRSWPNIEVVEDFGKFESLEDLVRTVSKLENLEGCILKDYQTGLHIKIKGDWYLDLHRNLDGLNHEKNVWDLIAKNQTDDLLPRLPDYMRHRLADFQNRLVAEMESLARSLRKGYGDYYNLDRKVFAQRVNQMVSPDLRPLMFRMYDGNDSMELVRSFILKNTGTSTKIQSIRRYFSNIKWQTIEE